MSLSILSFKLFLFLKRTKKHPEIYPTRNANKIIQVNINVDFDLLMNLQFSFSLTKIYVTTENEKSRNTPVIYKMTVLNFKSLKIYFISSLIFSLKHGIIYRLAIIANNIIEILISLRDLLNKHLVWFKFSLKTFFLVVNYFI